MAAAATVITGSGFTVTSTVLLPVQPFAPTPVSVYTVVATGSATGFVHEVHDRPVPGDQV